MLRSREDENGVRATPELDPRTAGLSAKPTPRALAIAARMDVQPGRSPPRDGSQGRGHAAKTPAPFSTYPRHETPGGQPPGARTGPSVRE